MDINSTPTVMKTSYFSLLLLAAAGLSTVLHSCQAPPQSCDLSQADKDSLIKVHTSVTGIVNENSSPESWAEYAKALYADDAIVMPSGGPAIQGKDAIVSQMASGMVGITKFHTENVEIEGSGNMAYVRGTYEMTFQINDSLSMDDKGKFIEIWRKDTAGKWKCTRDIYNSDLSPEAGASEPEMAPTEEASAATTTEQ